MIELTAVSPEVYYAAARFPIADQGIIDHLLSTAASLPRKRCRVCFHADPKDSIHEMLIVHHRSCYVRPHQHLGREESLMVLRGEVDLTVFEPDGRLRRTVRMGGPDSGLPFYYRMPAETLHSLAIHSEWLVFQEVSAGPFDPACSLFPQWAPDGSDAAIADAWVQDLHRRVATHKDQP